MPDYPPCQHDISLAHNTMVYQGCAVKDASAVHFWKCRHCGALYDKEWYRYNPQACPQHIPEFVGWEFIDDPNHYQLNRVWVCALCALRWLEPCDVRTHGNPEITLDHPMVEKHLLWNKSVADRVLKGED